MILKLCRYIFRLLTFSVTKQIDSVKSDNKYSGALIKAKVVKICDGDCFLASTAEGEEYIRLSSIDAPERDQPGGSKATLALNNLIGGGKIVFLKRLYADPYKRTVAMVYVEKDAELINVSEKLVICGHAWVLRRHYGHLSNEGRRSLNLKENWAKEKRIGLWKDENPIPPWIWRKSKLPKNAG